MVATVLIWKMPMVVSQLKLTVLALTSCTEEFPMHDYSTECPKDFGYYLSCKACSSSLCSLLCCKLLLRDFPSACKTVKSLKCWPLVTVAYHFNFYCAAEADIDEHIRLRIITTGMFLCLLC